MEIYTNMQLIWFYKTCAHRLKTSNCVSSTTSGYWSHPCTQSILDVSHPVALTDWHHGHSALVSVLL